VRDLREPFKPLACQRGFVEGEAGDELSRGTMPVATGSVTAAKTIRAL
jgi:hypothetical protein